MNLTDLCKHREIDEIDSLVSAEIPDKAKDNLLYEFVKTNLVHAPCGALNSSSVCMKAGKCKKPFPKWFSESTAENVYGYSLYKIMVLLL